MKGYDDHFLFWQPQLKVSAKLQITGIEEIKDALPNTHCGNVLIVRVALFIS
jgi:hypothetical protein